MVRPLFCLLLLCGLFSCQQEKSYTTETGLQYRLFPAKSKDSVARMGQTVKLHYRQQVGDSLIEQTYDRMPLYYTVMPGYGNRYNPLEVFDYGLKKGDSVVTVQLVDSMLRKGIFKTMPAWMKKEDKWYTYFKVYEVFRSDSLLQADKQLETKRVIALQKTMSAERIRAYCNARTIKTAAFEEVFTAIINPGSGPVLDSAANVTALLHVRTLKDTVLTQRDTIRFALQTGYFPAPVDKALKGFRQGSKIWVLVPAVVLLGAEPGSPQLKADDDLLFEVEVLQKN